MLPHNGFLRVALFASALSIQVPSTRADDAYRSEIERFRQRRVADLKAEDGWLSVVGCTGCTRESLGSAVIRRATSCYRRAHPPSWAV